MNSLLNFAFAPGKTISPSAATLLALWLVSGTTLFGQQAPDLAYDVSVAKPTYTDKHPKVLFDEAHFNVHTTRDGYKPFADLVRNDGYQVTPGDKPFEARVLAATEILVIANARGTAQRSEKPAFTEAECDAVQEWVRGGGSLLLVTDHYPIGHAAENLSRRFGVDMSKGTTMDPAHQAVGVGGPSCLLFARTNQLLGDHFITRGRNEAEKINQVVTFTGQSLKGPADSVVLLKLGDTAFDRMPSDNNKPVPAAGRNQGLALKFGKGRVVVLGEASDISAQRAGPQNRPMGMNYANCDNRQFALNILHWLSQLAD